MECSSRVHVDANKLNKPQTEFKCNNEMKKRFYKIRRSFSNPVLWERMLESAKRVTFLNNEEILMYAAALYDAQMWAEHVSKKRR